MKLEMDGIKIKIKEDKEDRSFGLIKNPNDPGDPITGPRENNGHGNNLLGFDGTNPGASFGFPEQDPFDPDLELIGGGEITPARGASELISLFAIDGYSPNNNGDGGY